MAASLAAISRRNSRARARSITDARLGACPSATSRSSCWTVRSASRTAIWVVIVLRYPYWYSFCNRSGIRWDPAHGPMQRGDEVSGFELGPDRGQVPVRPDHVHAVGGRADGGGEHAANVDLVERVAGDRRAGGGGHRFRRRLGGRRARGEQYE